MLEAIYLEGEVRGTVGAGAVVARAIVVCRGLE